MRERGFTLAVAAATELSIRKEEAFNDDARRLNFQEIKVNTKTAKKSCLPGVAFFISVALDLEKKNVYRIRRRRGGRVTSRYPIKVELHVELVEVFRVEFCLIT